MASVRFENVSISYGAKQVVKDFSLSVNDGEIMGIIGPSGCGKTTLIRALCGLIKPDKGNIYINDQLVFSDEKRINVAPERRGIGVVFQDYAVWPHLSVWDNVCYPMKKHKVPKEEIAKRAAYALEQVRMTGYEKHMPAQLSGGQRQRVGIARALAAGPELLLMDEPFGAVDEITRGQLQDEFLRIHRESGITVLFVTHDIAEALKLGTRTLVMDAGQTLLENGGEVFRVQQTMEIMAHSLGVRDFHVYVLTNGIFASASMGSTHNVSLIRHVPSVSIHLGRVEAINELSRELAAGRLGVEEAEARLQQARSVPRTSPAGERLACIVGAAGFAYLFGGTPLDAAVATVAGLLEILICQWFGQHKINRIFTDIVAAFACTVWSVGVQAALPAVSANAAIIGALMVLTPGVALTMGVRDILNGDYLSGSIRLLDAVLIAGSIACGVVLGWLVMHGLGVAV